MGDCKQNEFLCTWKIKQYSVAAEKGFNISSPVVVFGREYWELLLSPTRLTGNIACWLYRRLIFDLDKDVTIAAQFTLKNSNGVILIATEVTTETFGKEHTSTCCQLIGIEDLKKKMSFWSDDTLILCCSMRSISSAIPPQLSEELNIGCEMETEVCDNEVSFIVHVKISDNNNFSASKEVNNKFLERITLEYINIALDIKIFGNKKDKPMHTFDCTIELLNELGNRVISKRKNITFGAYSQEYVFPTFIYKPHLEKANYYNFGEIKLNFIVSNQYTSKKCYYKEDSTNSKIPATADSTFVSLNTTQCSSKELKVHTSSKAYLKISNGNDACTFSLKRDLRNLFVGKFHTDVELRVKSEIFHAHKSLLAARSPVFLAMFDQDTHNTGVVNIHDVEVNIMKIFLEYVYTGSIDDMDAKIALSLMLVANKYQVLSLAEKCSSFLKSALCINNALDVLSAAKMVNQEQLKSSAIEYIVDNSTEILSLSEWPLWIKLNPTLSSEVFLKLSKKVDVVLKSTKEGPAPFSLRRNVEAKSDVTEMPDEKCIGKCPPTDY